MQFIFFNAGGVVMYPLVYLCNAKYLSAEYVSSYNLNSTIVV